MTCTLRLLLASMLAMSVPACKDEAKPNPELKIPDVPESGSSQGKGDMTKLKGKK